MLETRKLGVFVSEDESVATVAIGRDHKPRSWGIVLVEAIFVIGKVVVEEARVVVESGLMGFRSSGELD